MEQPYLFNLQKYSIHDGEGIRTTVFFKGCPLHCLWCHNPESQSFEREILYREDKCVNCLKCAQVCKNQALLWTGSQWQYKKENCLICETCIDECLRGARSLVGKTYGIEELIKELERDRIFYEESGGGITLSGGEVLAQNIDYVRDLVKQLHSLGYSIAIDTCGHIPFSNFECILPFTAFFLYDIKCMDTMRHKQYTGTGNELILENLKCLHEKGADIRLRLPLIAELNDRDRDIEELIFYLQENKIVPTQIHLLPYHDLGKSKYRQLLQIYNSEVMRPPSQERLIEIRQLFNKYGNYHVIIGG